MMKKLIPALFFVTLIFNLSEAQILITGPDNAPSNPINCPLFNDGSVRNFFDSGDAAADYGNNENEVITICPDLVNGSKISVSFATNIGFSWNVDATDTLYIYDGSSTSAALLGAYNSITNPNGFFITASFNNPSGCLTFKFVSNGATVGTGWAANISCGNPPQPFNPHIQAFLNGSGTDFLSPVDTGYADICFEDSILFVATGTYPFAPIPPATFPGYVQNDNNCTYLWNISDGSTSTNDSVWFKPPNRSGYLVTLRMTDPSNLIQVIKCKVRVSTIPSFAEMGGALDDTICIGQSTIILGGATNTDTIGVNGTQTSFEVGGVFAGLTYLPDGSGTNYTTNIAIGDFNSGQTITSASDIQQMCVTMEHSFLGDIEMVLTCPNGTQTTIFNSFNGFGGLVPGGFGGGGTFLGQADDNGNGTPGIGWEYCFADNAVWGTFPAQFAAGGFTAVTSPSFGQAMSAGTYKPEQNFSNFIGCPINGNWSITVRDNQGVDDGYIFEWGIFFNPVINPNTEYYTPNIVSEGWQADPTIISGQGDTAIVVQPNAIGPHSYTFSVTDNFGCSYDTTVTIHVVGLNNVGTTTDETCDFSYQVTNIAAPGGVTWSIVSQPPGSNIVFGPNANVLNPLITSDLVGTLQMTITDNVCNMTGSYHLTYLDDPKPFVSDTTRCINDLLMLSVRGGGAGSTYLWNTGSTDTVAQATASGTYYVNVTNDCATVTDSAKVVFFSCDLNVPNVLTPNGKGNSLNELFYLKNLDFYPNTSLSIFDRWGLKLFETTDYKNDWSGAKYQDGVYYFILSGPKLIEPQKGFFHIIR
ncbi:MAG: gliding motility-associated C-terminal domain-containing protein [Bacteroidota bacterium]